GLFDWDLLTNEVYFSPRWKSMLGYADHELANRLSTWLRLLHPADRAGTLRSVRNYIKGGTSDRAEIEFRLRHKLGHYVAILSRAFLARDAGGSAVRMAGTHVDLTDQRDQRELYSSIVNQAPDGVVLIDCETLGFREFNDKACAGLGYAREEFALLTVRDVNA